MKTSACVAVVKNEESDIAEWCLYHLALGFDAIIVYDNQSTDQTLDILNRLAMNENIIVRSWPNVSASYQIEAYNDAILEYGNAFLWLAFIDTDEFLAIHNGRNFIDTLDSIPPNVNGVAISWAIFGSSGHVDRPDGLVSDEFIRRAPPAFGPNCHVKVMIRPAKASEMVNPHYCEIEGPYVFLDSTSVDWSENKGVVQFPNYSVGKINHYFVRSKAHWWAKMSRGYHDTSRSAELFDAYDRNEIEDTSARIFSTELRGKIGIYNWTTGMALAPFSGHHALMTEHNTLVCFDPFRNVVVHRAIKDLKGFLVVYLDLSTVARLLIFRGNEIIDLDPITCRKGRAAMVYSAQILNGSIAGTISLQVSGGSFLSARSDGSILSSARSRHTWESFSIFRHAVIEGVVEIAAHEWVIRGKEDVGPASVEVIGRNMLQIGHQHYRIDENFPLDDRERRKLGSLNSVCLIRNKWIVDELIRYSPLVVFVLFGLGTTADQLKIASQSLLEHGKYFGPILVLTDQASLDVERLFPYALHAKLLIKQVEGHDRLDYMATRLTFASMVEVAKMQPVLYMDADVVVDAPVFSILKKIVLSSKMTAQEEEFNPLPIAMPAGAQLFEHDAIEAKGLFGFNAGIWGFPNMVDYAGALNLMHRSLLAYAHLHGRFKLQWMDQAIANYIARKLQIFDGEILSEGVRIPLPPDKELDVGEARGFVHFWPYDGGLAKVKAMKVYLAALDNKRVGDAL